MDISKQRNKFLDRYGILYIWHEKNTVFAKSHLLIHKYLKLIKP